MTEKTLSSGHKVFIRRLSRKDIRNIKNLASQRLYADGSIGMHGSGSIQDAWIDKGLGGLNDWKAVNGEVVPDDIIMQLNDSEQVELVQIIKDAQVVNPKTPSHLG